MSGTLRVLWEGLRAEWWDFFGGRGREIIREEVARKKGSLSEDGDEVGKVAAVRNGDGAVGFGTLFWRARRELEVSCVRRMELVVAEECCNEELTGSLV